MAETAIRSLSIYPLAIPLRRKVSHAASQRAVADPVAPQSGGPSQSPEQDIGNQHRLTGVQSHGGEQRGAGENQKDGKNDALIGH